MVGSSSMQTGHVMTRVLSVARLSDVGGALLEDDDVLLLLLVVVAVESVRWGCVLLVLRGLEGGSTWTSFSSSLSPNTRMLSRCEGSITWSLFLCLLLLVLTLSITTGDGCVRSTMSLCMGGVILPGLRTGPGEVRSITDLSREPGREANTSTSSSMFLALVNDVINTSASLSRRAGRGRGLAIFPLRSSCSVLYLLLSTFRLILHFGLSRIYCCFPPTHSVFTLIL